MRTEETSLILQFLLSQWISHKLSFNKTALLHKKPCFWLFIKFNLIIVSSFNLTVINSLRSDVHNNDIPSMHLPKLALNKLHSFFFQLIKIIFFDDKRVTFNTSLIFYCDTSVQRLRLKFLHIHLKTCQLEVHAPLESSHQSFY